MVTPVSSTGISQLASAHTLQAFIELVYIKTANDVMVNQMGSLETALATTKSAMDTLTQIQNLHNTINVKSKGTFNPGYYSAGATVAQYTQAASAFFGTPVGVSASFAGITGGFAGFQAKMSLIVSQLKSQISALSATTPQISGREDSNSLLAKLRLVLKDINDTHAASTLGGAQAWVIDNYTSQQSILTNTVTNGTISSGSYQQNITNAITAGQSLNTTQTESVRNFLYVFEEYYKSASAVLQAITQIIQKMADGIAR